MTTVNVKHSLTPSRTDIDHVLKAYLPLLLLSNPSFAEFNRKSTSHAKRQGKHSLKKTKQTSEPDSDVAEILESSEQEFKTTMIDS